MARNRVKKDDAEFKYKLDITWSTEDDTYVVRVPELEGCVTHGESMEEAVAHAKEAISGYLDSLRARGLPVPKPLAKQNFSGKIPLRIDPSLHCASYEEGLYQRLKDPAYASEYLITNLIEEDADEQDIKAFLIALQDVANAYSEEK